MRERDSGGVQRRGFSAWVPIPNGRGRHRAAPFGVGPWDGARVASQQGPTLRPGRCYCSRQEESAESDKTERRMRKQASARLFDRSCPVATRDPSRWGQLGSVRGCGGLGQQWPRPAARRVGWSGPGGEEFAPDTSASARIRYRAELLAIIVSGTLRRNVLGAIASEKNDCNFPQRSNDNRDVARKARAGIVHDLRCSRKTCAPPERYQCAETRREAVST
jgi:hypothetical protein